MDNYYIDRLSAEKLKLCYELATPRVKQYLDAESEFVRQKIYPGNLVLELGCGYGRILPAIAGKARAVVGIDISLPSLLFGRETIKNVPNCFWAQMDALRLSFFDNSFDTVICIQNGISAFQVDGKALVRESLRVTRDKGTIIFSSYSEKFWEHRIEWFRIQSKAGLLGVIDDNKTRDGRIVCQDGFAASTVNSIQFLELTSEFNVDTNTIEVDESSLFCEIIPRKGHA
jgi:2-polyprenyl-6-hydroxyphenyl methylase/3-demethylubiquinone-9 3-methyltransferase